MLLGCFAVFWTVYYMLEVYLTRHQVTFDLTCHSSSACRWYHRGGKHRSLEDGLEMESVLLYTEKDMEEVEVEADPPMPSLGTQGDEAGWSPLAPKFSTSERTTGFHEGARAGPGYSGRDMASELLLANREQQTC